MAARSLKKPSPLHARFKTVLKDIRLVAFDVDGVLTDGTVKWIKGQGFTRRFTIKDGYGIRLLMQSGIEVAICSGGASLDLKARIEWLKIPHAHLGEEDKLSSIKMVCKKTRLSLEQVAFIGDDLFDIPALKAVRFSATVPDAPIQVKAAVQAMTETLGGRGAGRELADAILIAQKKLKI